MRVLVTGGAGYIGSHAMRLLLARGHDAVAYDNLTYGHRAAVPEGRLIVGDLLDEARLEEAVAGCDAIMHFAAFALVGESVRDPAKYYRNNVEGSGALMRLAVQHGVQRFVFSSTCATYGTPRSVPITEDEAQDPINPYGGTKLAVERALCDFARAYPLGVALLRYFNAAGASPSGDIGEDHDPETHLIPLVIQAALGRRPEVEVFGDDYPTPDGTCIRDYVHVDDLADAHLLALERLTPGRILRCNLGTGRGHSVRQVLRAVEEVGGRPVPSRTAPRRAGDPAELVASSELARKELGWAPVYTDLRRIIETAWKWHESHPRGYDDRQPRAEARP
jgi:UDP-glucose-4-epimerase GalE